MQDLQQKLEALFDKVRALPQKQQKAAAEALDEIASEPYSLFKDELLVLEPALERAELGEFADETEVSEFLHKTWC